MLTESFDFNKAATTARKKISTVASASFLKIQAEQFYDYIIDFIRNVAYKNYTYTVDKLLKVHEPVIENDKATIFIDMKMLNEYSKIYIDKNGTLDIKSGTHCIDITPIIYFLIRNGKYKINYIEPLEPPTDHQALMSTHGTWFTGFYIDPKGHNEYATFDPTTYSVIDYDFTTKFKDIKLSLCHPKKTQILIQKGLLFKSEEIFNDFMQPLLKAGFTTFNEHVKEYNTLHKLEMARYMDYRHKNAPFGGFYILGKKYPKPVRTPRK